MQKVDAHENFPERATMLESEWQVKQQVAIARSNKEAILFNKDDWFPRVKKLTKEAGRKVANFLEESEVIRLNAKYYPPLEKFEAPQVVKRIHAVKTSKFSGRIYEN